MVTACTLQDIESLLRNNKLFIANSITEIELEVDIFRVHTGRMPREEAKVKVVQVYVREDKKHKAQSVFRRTYPSIPRRDYPLRIPWRFVPDICDPDLPVTTRMRAIAESLRHKQHAFNQNTVLREYTHIRGIHKALPTKPSIILSQVLMSWYSQRFPTRLLFVAVQQDYDYAPVKLSYSQDLSLIHI